MTITWTLENESSETPEAVDIAPFARSAWVKTDAEGTDGALTATEHRVAGDSPEYPLVRTVQVRSAKIFHPAQAKGAAVNGRQYSVKIHSTQKVEDSVSGIVAYVPIATQVAIIHGGGTIVNAADVLQMLLSTVAELYDSVTTGTPDSVVIGKLALGASDI
jgi:hypothetical protein